MSNFAFLKEKWPVLANLGETAERNLGHDPKLKVRRRSKRTVGQVAAGYFGEGVPGGNA